MEINLKDKCTNCELRRLVINIKTQEVHSYCPICPHEELGNNAEPIREYPDEPDFFDVDMQISERAEKDMGAK